jgi:hypothetical protein
MAVFAADAKAIMTAILENAALWEYVGRVALYVAME